jgi:hypothetical protein
MELTDWVYLLDPHSLLLATPGLLSALLLTYISRKATNDAVLPIAMVMIPTTFYVVLFLSGISLEQARDIGWVGEVSPTVQFNDLLHLVDFSLVHWSLVTKCIGTWVGMVFVVSFASCLDIAAVSMDMGEALDTNKEMVTVGASNLMSGCLFGFTGVIFRSYMSAVVMLCLTSFVRPCLMHPDRIIHLLSDNLYVSNWLSLEVDCCLYNDSISCCLCQHNQCASNCTSVLPWCNSDLYWI